MVVLFSNHCPRCKTIEKQLTDKKIPFEIVTDEDEIYEVATANKEYSMPFAMIDGVFHNFKEIIQWLNKQGD